MHMHMLDARWAYHHTDPSGTGLMWLQYCSPPVTIYIRWLELENHGHTGGLHSWNSALGCRLRVQAPGRGSFFPVATSSCVVIKLVQSYCILQWVSNRWTVCLKTLPKITYIRLHCTAAFIAHALPWFQGVVLRLFLDHFQIWNFGLEGMMVMVYPVWKEA